MTIEKHDILVIGSGAAGLTLALELADHLDVAVLSKSELNSGSTRWAQGGIAGVVDPNDTVESHVADTLNAGGGLCDESRVAHIVENSADAIHWLVNQGVEFTKDTAGEFHLTQEGGHSVRRILHSADATGEAIASTLIRNTLAHDNIKVYDHHIAVDLITEASSSSPKVKCTGAYVLDTQSERVKTFAAKFVILATGGASKVYLYTSNPDGSSGDGIAMAWRAGCRAVNMEFNQFHPTCLFHPKAKSFLITEALRGEGALLKLPNGKRFMDSFDERAELAPRDIVARAIDHEMKRLGSDCLFLDISHKDDDFIKSHFPTVYANCLKYNIDITKEAIPVVPAAHYTCGGIWVDTNGCTDLRHLYAIGECTYTGLHGANRMASNSLLECIVYGRSAAKHILEQAPKVKLSLNASRWDDSRVTDSDEDVIISHNWDELRRFMWDYVGIVRTKKRLERAEHRIKLLKREIAEYYSNYKVSSDLVELRNLAVVADLIIRSAMTRKESRGLHYTLDYPNRADIARNTIMVPINFAGQDIIIND